ncbi:transmembrane protein, putative (macronuclear) [Tetrahymena thermophila SB210]|uniref:Transmembrane protein, putative n=1 Tax=Tetrahymena thermophila (strain SB210) TaxID=312017 RepID=Q23G63_TETTS|nr:transmembrane protein, putative [Tetrahymena thermophila SB210]EAR95397.3 transmembrane protein, putative [Tetrahymena thermophila SB210]|eukprot:XP_001015642.3 transmembrane protein, putative [Tetrahymena thermophila SB210]
MKFVFIIVIFLLKTFNCQYWYLFAQNLGNGFSQTDGWSTTNSQCDTSSCNNSNLLGGSSCFQDQTKAFKTFNNLPQHYQVKIDFTLWFLGLYDGDQVTATVGGTSKSYQAYYDFNNYYLCVDGQDQTKQGSVVTSDSNLSISVTFEGQINYQYFSQGWGVSDFSLSVQLCNPTCNQCNGVEAYSCISCWPNSTLVNYQGNSGFCHCNPGYYAVTKDIPCFNPPCFQCNQCDSSCATCTAGDQYSCVICAANNYKQYYGSDLVSNSDPRYQKSLCQPACFAANYYIDQDSQSCLKCADSCLTCNGQLDSNCLTCPPNFYLDGQSFGYCVSTCSSSYYKDDSTMKCLKCNSNCLECTQNQPDFCSKCTNGNYLTIGTGLCVSDCGQGQWGRNTDWSCQYCNSSCYTCSQSATNCTSCTGVLYLYNNQCLNDCPDGYYKGINNTCQQCDPSCKTCDNAGNTSCLSCSPSYGYLKNGMCIQCPIQFYGENNNQTCQPCHSSCYSCDAGTSQDCLSCSTNFLQNRQCIPVCSDGYWGNSSTHTCDQCDPNCLTCQPQGPSTSCLSCSSPLFLKSFTCISSCNPIGEYGDTNTRKCTPCDNSCYTCNQQNNNNCLSCTGLLQFYQNQCLNTCSPSYYGYNNVCQKQCPNNMYPDDSTNLCQPCNPICPTCFGSQTSQCYSCQDPYYLDVHTCVLQCPSNKYKNIQNQKCDLCDLSCLTCDGGSNQNCTSCSPTLYFGNNQCFSSCLTPYFSSTVTMQCVLQCPGGYWGDVNSPQRLCQPCNPQCDLCYGGTFAQCTRCSANYYLFQNTCDSCPINYFPNTDTRKCDKCFQTCQSCNGPSSSNCLSCNTGYFYLPDTQTCYSVCPIPYFSHFTQPNCLVSCPNNYIKPLYGDPKTRECLICDISCQKCTGPSNLNCINCAQGYYSYSQNKSCVLTCPDGTYADAQSMQCLSCDSSCATCNQGSSGSCLSCLLPSVLYNGQCIQNCPNSLYKDLDLKQCVQDCTARFPNKYPNKSDMTCQYCNPYCQQCTGPLSTQCITCKNPYLKFNTSCLSQCQQGTYFNSQKVNSNDNDCKQCNPACLDCYGPESNNCVTCSPTLYTLTQNGSTICLSDCPDLYIKNQQKMTCTTCPQLTYFNQGQCQKCHYSCQSCFGSFQNQCLACQNTRGSDSSNNPFQGICSCQSGYIETYQSECELTPQNVSAATKATYAFAISGTTTSILIGILGRNMFFIYNILEAAQFTSFLKYINVNYPLNLQSIFEKLYISQISSIVDLNPQSSSSTNQAQSNSTTKNRMLEWNSYENSNFIFEVQGNNSPLWQSFFFLILLNILSWVFVLGLNVLVINWKIKYNQVFLIEKLRCWTSYGLPIQTFLRTSMEAILFIVLCFKQAQQLSAVDWIFCLYFLLLLVTIIVVMIYQNIQPVKLDSENQYVIQILKLKKNKVNDEQAQIEKTNQTYPHPFRTLWQFTKNDKISRNYFVINLVSKIFIVVLTVELVSDPSKQILSIAIIKAIYFLVVLLIRPMVNFLFNSFIIFNELLLSVICFLIFKISVSSNEDQNNYGLAVLILVLILFLLNLLGSLISLIFILKKLFYLFKNKEKNQKPIQISQDESRVDNLNKSQQIDMFNYDQQLRQKKASTNIIDNSSTIQIHRDNQEDFDQSKTIQNQTVFQYDYENPFQFLEIQSSDRQNNKNMKKSKKNDQHQQSSPQIKKNQEDHIEINKLGDNKMNDYDVPNQDNTEINYSENNQQQMSIKQSSSDYIKNNSHPKLMKETLSNKQLPNNYKQQRQQKHQKEYQQQNERLKQQQQKEQLQQSDKLNCQISQNQQEFREGSNQNADDLSDYIYKANVQSQTPVTQFISFTPIQNNNVIQNNDLENHFELENTSNKQKSPLNLFPIQKPKQVEQFFKLEDLENTDLSQMNKSPQIKKVSQRSAGNLGHLQEIDQQQIKKSPITKNAQNIHTKQEYQLTDNFDKIEDFQDTELLSINRSPFIQKIPSQFLIKQDNQMLDNFQKSLFIEDNQFQQLNRTPQTKKAQQLQIKYDKKPDEGYEEKIENLNIKEEEISKNQSSFINNLASKKLKRKKVREDMKTYKKENKEEDDSQNKTSFINDISKQKLQKKKTMQLKINENYEN